MSAHAVERALIRVAIVNRGESAVRALQTLAETRSDGRRYWSIALYTDPDRNAIFVQRADEAIYLGPAQYFDEREQRPRHTYLDHVRLLAALKAARADAVWVGWGFVAEDPDFAALCRENGIVFIGPPTEAMRSLADKIQAKRIAERAGVPVVPWSGGPVSTAEEAEVHAEHIGYPLLIKATAGGGGRGIREVREKSSVSRLFAEAREEGKHAFGDPTVFMERKAANARHIEVQVLADHAGTIWILGVRECSVQRKRQKILEESALMIANPAVEARVRDYARAICAAVGYASTGTVEFLYEPETDAIYFMEVNTRLQVEHTVTEMVTGLDLVRCQLDVAFGDRLGQLSPAPSGHAIEVRLNAEDADRKFAPAPGAIKLYRPPSGPGIRVDSGVCEGDSIPGDFDSMIAKIIAWGPDRQSAMSRLERALSQTDIVIEGGTSNKSFLLKLVRRPELEAGRIGTAWLDEALDQDAGWESPFGAVALMQAAVEVYEEELRIECAHFLATAARGRPEVDDRNGRDIELRHRGNSHSFRVSKLSPNCYRVRWGDDRAIDVCLRRLGNYESALEAGGWHYRILTVANGPEYLIEVNGMGHRISRNDGGMMRSPCPAVVASVLTKPGQQVAPGTPLFIIESMKMQSTISAPFAGRVTQVIASAGAQIDAGDALARIDVAENGDAADPTVADNDLADFGRGLSVGCVERSAFSVVQSLVLGFDVECAEPEAAVELFKTLQTEREDADAELLQWESRIVADFCDIHALAPGPLATNAQDGVRPEDYLLTYLRSPEAPSESLPAEFMADLEVALLHYDAEGRTPPADVDEALLRICVSRTRMRAQQALIVSILLRWRAKARALLSRFNDDQRVLLERLARVTDTCAPTVCDLARAVMFRFVEQPLLDERREAALAELRADLETPELLAGGELAAARIRHLARSPEPWHTWLAPWIRATGPAAWRVGLEVYLRIQYRHLDLEIVHAEILSGIPVVVASAQRGERLSIIATFDDCADYRAAMMRVSGVAQQATKDAGKIVVELVRLVAENGAEPDAADTLRLAEEYLHTAHCLVTCELPHAPHAAARYRNYARAANGHWEAGPFHDFHPGTSERLDLWRLSNFSVSTLRASGDSYLLACSARDNARDQRLFAMCEVRAANSVGKERATWHAMELALLKCLDLLRQQQCSYPGRNPWSWNRVVLYLEPEWDGGVEELKRLAERIAPATRGLALEQIVLRLRTREEGGVATRDAVAILSVPAGVGIQIGFKEPSEQPIRSLSDYRAKSAEMKRLGFVYPYDIVRLLTSPGVAHSDFPPGKFTEYDLDADLQLVATERPYGRNSANLVVGVVTNFTAKHPEGIERVLILNDPSKSLGSLGEAECRRILAALWLARERGIPVEWFAVSSGARVAMASGTENMDWTARVLREIVEFTQAGGEINVVVTGINVGAQSYWNAEATMLMHTRGILIMTGDSAMVLTGKHALDYSGAVSAENNAGIGGYDRIMGPNGEAQYWARDVEAACELLFRHYDTCYVAPGERFPRRQVCADPATRDISAQPHPAFDGADFACVGDVFDGKKNPERKKPFDIRAVMRAVADGADHNAPLERWAHMRDADTSVVWDTHVGGIPVCMVGIESRELLRAGIAPADGPRRWSAGTLFPRSSKKAARAINAASRCRPVVVLANLSGFDGSPESMRELQLEYGAEIGRAVVNFRGPLIFCVLSRYHGGAFVVFSKALNDGMEAIAIEGAHASVLGGAPAAAVVFSRDVEERVRADRRVIALRQEVANASEAQSASATSRLVELIEQVRTEKRGEIAREFDAIHTIDRALAVGSIDRIVAASDLRAQIVAGLERSFAAES